MPPTTQNDRHDHITRGSAVKNAIRTTVDKPDVSFYQLPAKLSALLGVGTLNSQARATEYTDVLHFPDVNERMMGRWK